MQQNQNTENTKKMVDYLLLGQKSGIDMQDMNDMSLLLICDNLINNNDLKDIRKALNEEVQQDIPGVREIISMAKNIKNIEQEVNTQISFIESKVGQVTSAPTGAKPVRHDKIPKMFPGAESLKSFPDVNLNQITYEQFPLYSKSTQDINVTVMRGKLSNNQLVVVKIYSALGESKSQIDNQSYFTVLLPVMEEIKILKILSNRASDDNCFLKFYSEAQEERRIALYMEGCTRNLMDVLTEWKAKNVRPDNEFVKGWIVSLINAFAQLSTLKIYHSDIKPHNIIVTENWKLKIIDFGISKVSTEIEATMSPTCQFPIQGTRGYMAPELEELLSRGESKGNFKPGKADVFSLGLTILQILTFDDLTSLNIKKYNDVLLRKVSQLNCDPWIINLLNGMLAPDRKSRLSFLKCCRLLPADVTTYR